MNKVMSEIINMCGANKKIQTWVPMHRCKGYSHVGHRAYIHVYFHMVRGRCYQAERDEPSWCSGTWLGGGR